MEGDEEVTEDAGQEVQYEIAIEEESAPQSSAAPPESSPPPLSAPASPSIEDQLRTSQTQYQDLERKFNEVMGAVSPYLRVQQEQLARQGAAQVKTAEQLQTDPNTTVKDLLDFIQHQQGQGLQQIQSVAELSGRRAASTQRLRGLLTTDGVGAGLDFDSLYAKHVAPLYRQNPYAQQAVQFACPEDPALGEYILATIHEVAARAQGDPARTFKAIWDGLGAEQAGASAVTQKITEAQRRQAARIVPGSRPGTTQARKLGSHDISAMSDADFNAFDRQVSGGY